MGAIDQYGASMMDIRDQIARKNDLTNVFNQALIQYPILQNLGIAGVYTDIPGKYGGIESWPPGEVGEPGYARPKELPLEKFGVQVFKSGGIGGPVKPIDVLADVVSHHMVNTDPIMKDYYGQFRTSLMPYQHEKLRKDYDYDKQKGNIPFDQWVDQNRLPAFFRGYTFNQWPDEYNQSFYTPEQINLLNKVRDYLGVK